MTSPVSSAYLAPESLNIFKGACNSSMKFPHQYTVKMPTTTHIIPIIAGGVITSLSKSAPIIGTSADPMPLAIG